jgi:hypothetical protein
MTGMLTNPSIYDERKREQIYKIGVPKGHTLSNMLRLSFRYLLVSLPFASQLEFSPDRPDH